MRTRTNRALAAVGTSVLLTAVAACGGGDDGDASADSGLTTLVYAQPTPESMAFYAYVVADELGFFEEEGLAVELAPSSEDVPTSTLVVSGNADIGIAGGAEVLFAAATGREIAAVYDVLTASAEGLVVPGDSDVQSVADLDGATIGMASDEERPLVGTALEAEGLSLDDVELVVVGTSGPTLANELQSGNLDAFAGSLLDFSAMQAAGIETRNITPDALDESPTQVMVVSREKLESDREAIEGFLRAYAKATHLGLEDPDRVEEILRERVPDEWQDEAFGEALFSAGLDLWHPVGDQYGELRPDAWSSLQDQLIAFGELDEPVDIDGIIDDSLLEAANDWDRDSVGN
ncbi:ABC transporter substrate-binding protein [Blastococcus haudaquaticus]|uniref:Thiamine pyrimidine synthase n=1 Tax=Blastococcus haudaquaticus TaxID=1938745 RepID=A0A286H6I8_9ACTN|nr:ABC transporter substrate-binding protein [Blastococcus haudaquaticus]SOE03322.1 NitT/TauT family transport system substrate-binding protein [Blastococcus haudaquaticus]